MAYAIVNSERKVLEITDERTLEVIASGIPINELTEERLVCQIKSRDSRLARKGVYPYCKIY